MNERVKEIRKYMNLNQTEFAKLLGIGQSTLAMMEVSKRDISDRHIKAICAICGVNETWLRTGVGDMLEDTEEDFLTELSAKYHLDPFQQSLVRAVYEMSPEQRKAILVIARKLVAENPESEHEKITRIANDYLDAYEDTQPQSKSDTNA